jgi:HK97 family phage major capsid protein/HK97 family phage prohead protease
METTLPDVCTESNALRILDWPVSRRMELRDLLPSVPAGQSRIYQKSRVEALKNPDELARVRSAGNGSLFTRNGTAAAPPAEIHTRNFEFTRAAIDPRARTVELSFSSEAPVSRWFGQEVLSHTPGAVRLGRLNNGAALLLDHDPTKQIGIVVSARIDPDGKGRATVRFGNSALADEIFKDVQDGIRRLVSVGYRIHKQESQGKSGGVELVRVTDWEPYELSLVSIPADDSVGVGRGIETAPGNPNIESPNQVNTQTTENLDPAAIERTRTTRIIGMAEQAQRQGITVDANRAIADGLTPDQFREQLFEGLISRQTPYTPGHAPAQRGNGPDLGRYSLSRAIAGAAEGRLDGFEREMSDELARTMGRRPQGFFIPNEVLAQRAGMSVTGDAGAYGASAVPTVMNDLLEALRPQLAVANAGATVLSGLAGNIAIPTAGATAASWTTETGTLSEQTPAVDQLTMSPKRLGAFSVISRQLVAQTSGTIDAFLRRDLLTALAVALDSAAINGTGADNQPEGILATTGIGSVAGGAAGAAPTLTHLLSLVAAVANANADQGSTGFLINTKTEAKLRGTPRVASTDSEMLLNDGQTTLIGRRMHVSNNVPSNLVKGGSGAACSAIIFGNFADLVIGQWGGGIDLLVDPYTLSTSGQLRLVAQGFFDILVRRAESFAAMKDALTA